MSGNKKWLYGLHTVSSILQHHPERIVRLSVEKNASSSAIVKLAEREGIAIEFCLKSTLDKLAQGANHQGVLAYCLPLPTYKEADIDILFDNKKLPFILILDGVQDPHNLGACFRTADAAGVDAIIVPKDKSVGLTPTVSKVASGAVEHLPFIEVTNLARVLKQLKQKGIWIYGAHHTATSSLYQTDLKLPLAIVLGGEGKGLRRLTLEHCDVLLHVPMHGIVSSLNVSVATGVFLFEAVRQRNINR